FCLTERGEYLYGRGVSDAKFQLLNALLLFDRSHVNLIVDGAEESGGTQVGEYLSRVKARRLVIVDGSTEDAKQVYGGLSGQMDGRITIDTKEPPAHPGRTVRREMTHRIQKLFA